MTILNAAPIGLSPAPTQVPLVVPNPQRSMGIDERYVELTRIGAGGVSEIYRCFDRQLGRVVALKRLRGEKSNRKSDWKRFILEPEMMSMIDHPSVPAVHDVYPERMYKPYFTMDLIDGFDLREILSGLRKEDDRVVQAYPLKRLVQVLADVCDSLAVAHDHSIVHRDIKPENIMISNAQQVRLIDWGVAMMIDESSGVIRVSSQLGGPDRRIVEDPRSLGSPLYLSPEQVQRRANIDHRIDIYSLGVVLYDCLTLDTLIRSQSTPGIFSQICRGDHTPPSKRTNRKSIPGNLEAVCMKAIAMDPADRFETSADMGEALRGCFAGQTFS